MGILDWFRKTGRIPEKKIVLGQTGEHHLDETLNYDVALKKLITQRIKDTPANREFLFWNSNIAVTYTQLRATLTIGSGMKFSSKNKKGIDLIEKFNKKINPQGQNIQDLIRKLYFDLVPQGFSPWTVKIRKDGEDTENVGLSLFKLPPKTLTVVSHQYRGWKKYIQDAYIDPNMPNDKREFMRSYLPEYDEDEKLPQTQQMHVRIHIPERAVLYFDLFERPLISNAMQYIYFKMKITQYMEKYAHKFWAPTLKGVVGNKDYEASPEASQRENMQDFANELQKLHNFSAIVLPWYEDVEMMQTQHRGGSEYVTFLDWLDNQIIYTLMMSASLLQARGHEAVDASSIRGVIYRMIESDRSQIGNKLTEFYKLLCEYNDAGDIDDLIIEFSPLKGDQALDIVQMATMVQENAGFLDINEYRDKLRPVWPDLVKLTDKELKKAIENWKKLNVKETQMGFGQRTGETGAKPKPTQKKAIPQ